MTAPGRLQIEMGCSNQQLAGKHAPDSNRMEDGWLQMGQTTNSWAWGIGTCPLRLRKYGHCAWHMQYASHMRMGCPVVVVHVRVRSSGSRGPVWGSKQAVAHLITSALRSAHGHHPPVLVSPEHCRRGDCRWFITGGVSVHVSEPTLFNFPTNLGGVWS